MKTPTEILTMSETRMQDRKKGANIALSDVLTNVFGMLHASDKDDAVPTLVALALDYGLVDKLQEALNKLPKPVEIQDKPFPAQRESPWFWFSSNGVSSTHAYLEPPPTYCIDGNNLQGKLAAIGYVKEKYSLHLVDAKRMVDEIPEQPYGGLTATGPDAYVQCGEKRFYRIDNTLFDTRVKAAIYMRKKLDCQLSAVRAVDAIPEACTLPPQETPDTNTQPVITAGSDMLLPNTRR